MFMAAYSLPLPHCLHVMNIDFGKAREKGAKGTLLTKYEIPEIAPLEYIYIRSYKLLSKA